MSRETCVTAASKASPKTGKETCATCVEKDQDVDRLGKYISALSNGACLDTEMHMPGTVIDENYSLMLIERKDLTLEETVLLDKVQKHEDISEL